MLKLGKSPTRVASALLLSFVLAGCAMGPTSLPSPELLQRIEAAQTRADHAALALTYDQEATAARAKAAEHRKMAKGYEVRGAPMATHCVGIASSYESMAKEYDSMAAGHRQMAAEAKS